MRLTDAERVKTATLVAATFLAKVGDEEAADPAVMASSLELGFSLVEAAEKVYDARRVGRGPQAAKGLHPPYVQEDR